MIVFDLRCAHGHVFEEWFASSADFEAKTAAHEIACPQCGDHDVGKALQAPHVAGGSAAEPAAASCGLPACATGACPMMGGD